MTGSLAFLLALSAFALAAAVAGYLRREPLVRGRALLLALRGGALLLLTALLLNPPLPGAPPDRGRAPVTWVLLDAGPALDVPAAGGGTLRNEAIERATRAVRNGERLALAGPEPEGIDTAALARAGERPAVRDWRPAIVRLAEAGADSLRIVSPLRVPRVTFEAALAGLPVAVEVERLGGPVRNAGVFALELPERVAADEPIEGAATVFGEGGSAADTLTLTVIRDGDVVHSARLGLPDAGHRARVEFSLPPSADTGSVRLVAEVRLEGDGFPADDRRVGRVRVGPPEGGIVLVSLRPDWEPRLLLPVLEAATGLEGEGYLRVGSGDRWVPLGRGDDPATPVSADAFRDRLERAGVLVVHGVADTAPDEWLGRAAETHPRVLHFPGGVAGLRLAGLDAGPPRSGEWRPDPELPPSPVAPYLSGLSLGELPPLTAVRVPGGGGFAAVLRVRASVGGEEAPALVLEERPEGRRAVALATGFWRWGAREGAAREAYRGLWAGVAGWLLASGDLAGPDPIRPVQPVVERGRPFEWVAPAGAERVLELRLERVPEGDPPSDPDVRDVEIPLDALGRGIGEPLPPGRWRWEGRIAAEARGAGEVEVEGWSDALVHPPLDPVPEAPEPTAQVDAARAPGDPGRPLRTHPLPYLLLLGLLCAEWIGRRRVGLR